MKPHQHLALEVLGPYFYTIVVESSRHITCSRWYSAHCIAAPTRRRSARGAGGASVRGASGRRGRGASASGSGRGARGAGRERRARATTAPPRSPWRRLSTHTTRADIMIWRQNTGRKDCLGTTGLLSTSDHHHTTIPDQMIDSKLALTELDDDVLKY
ncbi:uncharacterized protein LOC119832606 [Zerene cesonia]|uniref:uncharacterized protein LOC119832606 n=1 Tax=Zerene cesonia TaxID=33412 RepID=UPI0018E53139|nr:uncharacterized protein LOC119832606 [Zerene cesonia]